MKLPEFKQYNWTLQLDVSLKTWTQPNSYSNVNSYIWISKSHLFSLPIDQGQRESQLAGDEWLYKLRILSVSHI